MNRRGILRLFAGLPIIGDAVAKELAAPLANGGRALFVKGTMATQLLNEAEKVAEEICVKEDKYYPRFQLPYSKKYLIGQLLNPDDVDLALSDEITDIDLVTNRSMSRAALRFIQRERNRVRARQSLLKDFREQFGFDFDPTNIEGTLLRIMQQKVIPKKHLPVGECSEEWKSVDDKSRLNRSFKKNPALI